MQPPNAASALTDAQRQTSFAAADEDDALVAVDRSRKKSKKDTRHKTRDRPEGVPKRRKKDKTGKKDILAKKGTEAKIEQQHNAPQVYCTAADKLGIRGACAHTMLAITHIACSSAITTGWQALLL